MSYILNRLRADIRSLNLSIATLTSPYTNTPAPQPVQYDNRPRGRVFGNFNPLSFRVVAPFAPRFFGFMPFPIQPRAARFWVPPQPPPTVQVIQPIISVIAGGGGSASVQNFSGSTISGGSAVVTNANSSNATVSIGGNNYGNVVINQGNATVGTPGTGGSGPTTTTSTTRAITTETIVRSTPALVSAGRVVATTQVRVDAATTKASNTQAKLELAQIQQSNALSVLNQLKTTGASNTQIKAAQRAVTSATNLLKAATAADNKADKAVVNQTAALNKATTKYNNIAAVNTTTITRVGVSTTTSSVA
jgi:hypothetical protein